MLATALVPFVCSSCLQPRLLEVGEELLSGQLNWFERFRCDCGHTFETGGAGLPSEGMRSAIVAQAGCSEVWVDDPEHGMEVLDLLLHGLGLSLSDAGEQLTQWPALVYQGTSVEAVFIAQALVKRGVITRVINHQEA